jgi:hypothetical protein
MQKYSLFGKVRESERKYVQKFVSIPMPRQHKDGIIKNLSLNLKHTRIATY